MTKTKILVAVLCLFVSDLSVAEPQIKQNDDGDSTAVISHAPKFQFVPQQTGGLNSPAAQDAMAASREAMISGPSTMPSEGSMPQSPVDNQTLWNQQNEIADKTTVGMGMEIVLWVLAAVGALFLLGFIHHKIKMKTDKYYRSQVEQSIQDRAFERTQAEFRKRMR